MDIITNNFVTLSILIFEHKQTNRTKNKQTNERTNKTKNDNSWREMKKKTV